MAKTCSALADFNSAGGFSICVQTNPTTGGVTASFASVCDLTLAEPGALIGFAGPRVIKATIRQELPPGFQRAEFLLEKGQVDSIVPREDLVGMLAKLIDYGTAGRPLQPREDSTGDSTGDFTEDPGSESEAGGSEAVSGEDVGSVSGEEPPAAPSTPEMDSGDAIPRPEQA
jgi:hypothetical protein